jgi:protein O-GlcNAc transferase
MKKLISLSVWGSNPRYVIGAHRQIELAAKYLPDWNVRIYTDDYKKFNHLKSVEVVRCEDGSAGMYWRFMPLFEDTYDVIASRDSDSRFSFRECKAMNEFADSYMKFHVIRDHDSHFQYPIMAGMFACRGGLPYYIKDNMIDCMLKNKSYLDDQNFLRDYVWPVVQKDTLVHSMNEGWFGDSRKTLRNRFSFCGNGYDENDMPLYPPTLQECVGFDPKNVDESFEFDGGFYD